MPRHEQISPDEDLASFYGATPPPLPGAVVTPPPLPGAAATPPPVPGSVVSAASFSPVDPSADLPVPGATPSEPASEQRRMAAVQRPMPTFPAQNAPAAVVAGAPNPVIAAVLSLFFPGAGQIYAGQGLKGGVLLLVAFFTCMGGGLLNIIAAIDAYLIAQRRAAGEPVGDWKFF